MYSSNLLPTFLASLAFVFLLNALLSVNQSITSELIVRNNLQMADLSTDKDKDSVTDVVI